MKEKMGRNEYVSHPSYGLLSFSRRHGGETCLFGSSIKHHDTIAMTLRHAKIKRDLSTDWYYGGDVIAEAEMSYSQFAEAITSMNAGSGIPVTVKYTEKDGSSPKCIFTSKREQFENELKTNIDDAMQNTKVLIKECQELFLSKKTLNKNDKEEILSKLHKIYSEISSNNTFIYDCFNEQMDKTVMEAKGEIEAFYQNKINTIAQAALVENRDVLLEDKPIDI